MKKIISIGSFAIFLFLFLFSGTTYAGFWDLFKIKKTPQQGVIIPSSGDSSGAAQIDKSFQSESDATPDLIGDFLTISPESADIEVGGSKNFQAFYQPLKSQSKNLVVAVWTTSDPAVATISYKKSLFFFNRKTVIISGVAVGTAKIKATYKNISFVVPVIVTVQQQYLLKVEITGSGQVKNTGKLGIIDCVKSEKDVTIDKHLPCSAKIDKGKSVALLAIPNEGYKFVFWSGRCEPRKDTMSADQNPKFCYLTMDKDKTVTAVFEKKNGVNTVNNYEKLNVIGDKSKLGSYDPSVEYDDRGVGYLAYSGASSFEFRDIDTHLAKSVNGGKTWTYAAHISQAKQTTIAYEDSAKKINVVQRHETPSLLFDPSDPDENGRWKLFLVSGFSVGEKGWTRNTIWSKIFVTFKKAKTPEMLAGAQETILFASEDSEEMPVGYSAKYNVDDFSPSLKKTFAYMEPGTLVKNGIIYLTLNAKRPAGEKTILLSSKDRGNSWGYVGTLIDDNEIVNSKYPILTSSSMAEENGRYFLLVSPKLAADRGGYNGVYIFEFENVESARLKRDDKGKLIVHKYVPTITTVGLGGGQSEYHSGNYYGGIMMSQSWMTGPINERFTVGSTKEKIVDY